jgi:YD repeat-containing protein
MIDGPLTGTDDAKYFRYDVLGRKTWELGEAAPDGTRIAQNITYRDADDKVSNVKVGTVSCGASCATATLTLTLTAQTDTTYDSRRYPIREQTYKGTTVYRVTDRSFLDRGLADCTTVRMNLASLPAATATGACTLGTTGSQGPDRITKNNYDSAGRLLKIQKAFGVSGLQQDYVTYAYTANGKQQFVTDANGNKAQYAYDGLDRLQYWYFPSATTVGSVNTADYEQYGYDLIGNRTSLRKRDGSTLTYAYDNLNRLISKVGSTTGGGGGGGGSSDCSGVSFAVNDDTEVEGTPLVFTITKSGTTSSTCSVSYATADGSATAPDYYTAVSSAATFLSGETSKSVTVTTFDLGRLNLTKKMYLNLSNASPGAIISDNQGIGFIEPSGGGGGGTCTPVCPFAPQGFEQ